MAEEKKKEDTKEEIVKEFPFHQALELPRVNLNNILLLEREISIEDVIDEHMARRVRQEIRALDMIAIAPIYIWINSPGGSIVDGLSIIDSFKTVSSPIVTVINGMAASMAAAVSLCGDMRLMTANSYWMQHPMSAWSCDYLEFMKDNLEFTKKLNARILTIMHQNSNLTEKQFEKMNHGELWLNARECKKVGVIDRVYPARKTASCEGFARSCDTPVLTKSKCKKTKKK